MLFPVDKRYLHLKNNLSKLNKKQLETLYKKCVSNDVCCDEYFYDGKKYCAMAIGLGIPEIVLTNNKEVGDKMISLGCTNITTSGIVGTFYTENRLEDLKRLIEELI